MASLVYPSVLYAVVFFLFSIRLIKTIHESGNTQLFWEEQAARTPNTIYIFVIVGSILFAVLGDYFVRSPYLVVLLNCTVWLPQIAKNVKNRSSNTPQISLAAMLTLT